LDQTPEEFPSKPILRLETHMHSSVIKRIDVDRNERYLVSGSRDKTVRIWDLSDGRLIRTLRTPMYEGNTGNVYSVAISPDGNHIAVGGWTRYNSAYENIYVYIRASGEMFQVIRGLPSHAFHLSYSPDGKYLAATLSDSNGLRIYESRTYTQVAEDSQYADHSYWADFNADGRLVTTSNDGYVRLYDTDFSLIHKKRTPGGKWPFSVVFSPDGKHIVVGYVKSARVDVLSAENLELCFSAMTNDITNGDLFAVAWSEDGKYLYAAGTYEVAKKIMIRRWYDGGHGDFTDFKTDFSGTVMDLKSLSNGRMAVGTGDPFIAVLSTDMQPIWKHTAEFANFSGQVGENGIRLSKRGDTVQFHYEFGDKRPVRFSLKTWQLELNHPSEDQLSGPITEAPGFKITDWRNEYTPKLNGNPLEIKKYENSHSLAIAPDNKRFLLGTEWRLRLFDQNGNQLWQVVSPEIAWSVNISGDGKSAVAAFGDGTIRWYRMTDGKEFLALFPHKDGKRWIAWTPQGFYKASAGAEDLIGWHLNQSSRNAPNFYSASRFRKQFYRPDVVDRVIDTLDVKRALAESDKSRGTETVIKDVISILPPKIKILSPAETTQTKSNKLTIIYMADSTTGKIEDIEARIDGRPANVLNHEQNEFNGDNKFIIIGEIEITLPPRNLQISLIAKNKHGSSEPATVTSIWVGDRDWFRPNLYVLAVGVTRYKKQHMNNLDYPAKDAEDFVKSIRSQEECGLYNKFMHKLIVSTDEVKEATRINILRGLEWLKNVSTDRDVAMVFLSGHGINDSVGNYNFLPLDAEDSSLYPNGIDSDDFRKFLSLTHGTKVFFFIDSCRSGSIKLYGTKGDQMPDVDKFANELADLESGVIVFSSSTGKQNSIELKEEDNGAFTKALIEGVEGQADAKGDSDRFVTIRELDVYLVDRVKQLTNEKQKPRTAMPKNIKEKMQNIRIMEVIQK